MVLGSKSNGGMVADGAVVDDSHRLPLRRDARAWFKDM
jgi:hypothetical protein